MDLDVIDNPPPDLVSELDDRIYEFNVSATGIADGRLLAILVKDSQGALMAGLSGHTWGGTCEIRLLWVAEDGRGHGLGARLLQTAEAEARSRACDQIVLSTHSFQAPGFYAKCGFVEVGRVHDYPRGHDSIPAEAVVNFLRRFLQGKWLGAMRRDGGGPAYGTTLPCCRLGSRVQ